MESLGFTAQLLEYTLQMGATFTVTSTENCGKVVVLSQINILGDNSCYKRFPEPDFGEMEGACLHTLHGPNATACSAAFRVTRTLDLKALDRSSSIFN